MVGYFRVFYSVFVFGLIWLWQLKPQLLAVRG